MTPELSGAIAKLEAAARECSDAAKEAKQAANGAQAAANASTTAVHGFSSTVGALTWQMRELWLRLFHELPPAPPPEWTAPPPGAPPAPYVVPATPALAKVAEAANARSSVAQNDVAELTGMLIRLNAEVEKQSKAMGIGSRGWAWLLSSAGQKQIRSTVAAIAATVAAVAAIASSCRAPAPALPRAESPAVVLPGGP